jgi:hypothetical protein
VLRKKSIILKNSYGVAGEQAVDLLFPDRRLFGAEMMILALERLGYLSSSLDNYSHNSHFANLLLVTHGIRHEMSAQ